MVFLLPCVLLGVGRGLDCALILSAGSSAFSTYFYSHDRRSKQDCGREGVEAGSTAVKIYIGNELSAATELDSAVCATRELCGRLMDDLCLSTASVLKDKSSHTHTAKVCLQAFDVDDRGTGGRMWCNAESDGEMCRLAGNAHSDDL